MTFSLNEIEAMSKRAARGSGLSWGLSEEAGKASRWLASHDLAGPAALADVLTQNDQQPCKDLTPKSLDGVWQARSGTLCPLVSGAALNDCAGRLTANQAIEMENVTHPLLVVPFAAWAAIHIGVPVAVTWLDVRLVTDGFGLWVDGPKEQLETTQPVSLTCMRAVDCEVTIAAPGHRGDVSTTSWACLSDLAHRTYASATEESRTLGAGAGTTDND